MLTVAILFLFFILKTMLVTHTKLDVCFKYLACDHYQVKKFYFYPDFAKSLSWPDDGFYHMICSNYCNDITTLL